MMMPPRVVSAVCRIHPAHGQFLVSRIAHFSQRAMRKKMAEGGGLMMAQSAMRTHIPSLPTLVEPYVPKDQRKGPQSYLSKEGMAYAKDAVVNVYKGFASLVAVKFKLGLMKFRVRQWAKEEAQSLYIALCQELAAGNKAALKNIATERYYTELKGAIKHRKAGYVWYGEQFSTKPLHYRVVNVDPTKQKLFAQITVRTTSMQRVEPIVASSKRKTKPSEWTHVSDCYVLERPLFNLENTAWRICGRL